MPGDTFDDVTSSVHDVVVVGAGPSGASCAYWLADAGWDVVVVEKKTLPREKTCGDGLTPRAVRQLADMGLEPLVAAVGHRFDGLRAVGFGHTMALRWPSHPHFPSYGYTITRLDLDAVVADHARRHGATILFGTEAVAALDAVPPLHDDRLGAAAGVMVRETETGRTAPLRARYLVVADGANSRLGRSLGASRRRDWPLGMALRGYWASPRHDDGFIESHLDVRDASGAVVPGYGWVFPLGDGRVNVGVGLLTTGRAWKGANTTRLMDAFVAQASDAWGLTEASCLGPATGGKLPMGLSIGPAVGDNVLLTGDALAAINPFNGEGIAYGYETGRLAAASIGAALQAHDAAELESYRDRLDASYGGYFRVARAFVRLISEPSVMQTCVGLGMRSEWLMSRLLVIMANLLRPDDLGAAELGYRAMTALVQRAPDGVVRSVLGAIEDRVEAGAVTPA